MIAKEIPNKVRIEIGKNFFGLAFHLGRLRSGFGLSWGFSIRKTSEANSQ